MSKDEFALGSPQRYAEDLYWQFSEFENLDVEEVKKCCLITLNRLMTEGDTATRLYFGECKHFIRKRGLTR